MAFLSFILKCDFLEPKYEDLIFFHKSSIFFALWKMPKQTLNKESFAVFKMKDTASFFAQLKKKYNLFFKLL